jgi:hypothetical protein
MVSPEILTETLVATHPASSTTELCVAFVGTEYPISDGNELYNISQASYFDGGLDITSTTAADIHEQVCFGMVSPKGLMQPSGYRERCGAYNRTISYRHMHSQIQSRLLELTGRLPPLCSLGGANEDSSSCLQRGNR